MEISCHPPKEYDTSQSWNFSKAESDFPISSIFQLTATFKGKKKVIFFGILKEKCPYQLFLFKAFPIDFLRKLFMKTKVKLTNYHDFFFNINKIIKYIFVLIFLLIIKYFWFLKSFSIRKKILLKLLFFILKIG